MSTPEQNIEQVKLTPKQVKFIKAYLATSNATESAKAAGCKCKTEDSFRSRGSQMLKELEISINQLMFYAGISNLDIVAGIKDGMLAKHTQVDIIKKTGEVIRNEIPDWGARARFTDMAVKLKGGYPKQQLELDLRDGRVMEAAILQKRLGALEQKLAA